MRSLLSVTTSLFILSLAFSSPLSAQGITGFIFASYYECDVSLEPALDDAVMSGAAAVWDRHVESGDITQWGWNAHTIGGAWRRLQYFITPDRASGLAAWTSVTEAMEKEAPGSMDLLNRACSRHQDYIWSVQQTSQAQNASSTSMPFTTAYYMCQQSRESEADEAFRNVWAPILDDLVREGHLTGWNWLAHDTGGFFRRAMSFFGSDHTSIMAARDELVSRLAGNEAASAVGSACGSHSDYAWTPVTGS